MLVIFLYQVSELVSSIISKTFQFIHTNVLRRYACAINFLVRSEFVSALSDVSAYFHFESAPAKKDDLNETNNFFLPFYVA